MKNKRIKLTLNELLAIHDQYKNSSTAPQILGDGFLYAKSEIFKKMRDWALANGISFAKKNDAIQDCYRAYPLLTLNEIFKTRKLPWMDNVTPLRHLAKNYNLDLTDTDLCPNFMLHETIHLFVNDFYGGHCPSYAEADSPNMLTARLLSGEACAGPLEFFVANEIPGVEFASIGRYNNYWRSDLHAHSLFLRLSQHCSKEYVFKFLFYSYLFINYYFEDISLAKKIRPKILDHLPPPENSKSVELLYKLSDKLFILNPTFIKRACRDYIHLIGGPSSLSEAYAFDLEKLAFDEDYFAPLLEHVAAFIFKNPKMRRPDSKLRSQSHRRHRQTDRGLGRVIR